ncbi:MAG: aminopeptidase P N-terminal domain-containing protein [Planctomycetes bacterium]|nr:aminopeptidase P N-terminal domain-containing protein [Planctomycetota bacterium]MCB9872219.1 aminopeptidase P N-terminal domain-containing protein [Planctomycetota bacterium]
MPTTAHLRQRRSQFLERITEPVLLMAGGEVPRNYPANVSPYRADSNFLFFFADPEPGSAALFDPRDRSVTLFLRERTAEDALWHGAVPDFATMQHQHGVEHVEPVEQLVASVQRRAGGAAVRTIAVADPQATALANQATGAQVAFLDSGKVADPAVIQAIGGLRVVKHSEELEEMRRTAVVTAEAHHAAMAHTRVGVTEQELCGIVTGVFARHGCVPAYNNILSVRGEVLHNHHYTNTLRDGDIVLLDAGAENGSGFCSDVTRSWPASGAFTAEAGAIYDVVLAAEKGAIAAVRPGVRYRDLHLRAARILAEGLVDLGLLHGDPDGLIESGAHAVFFPHGVGHLIGIDVHDMETFGDAIAYPAGRTRSTQFGTAYLRLDMDLLPGMTFTIEPGIYFVPAILGNSAFREQFGDQVGWGRAEQFLAANGGRGFGGIRIEDDVACTADGAEVLTASIAKERAEVEALVGSA